MLWLVEVITFELPPVKWPIQVDAQDPHEPHEGLQVMLYGMTGKLSSLAELGIPCHDLLCLERKGAL